MLCVLIVGWNLIWGMSTFLIIIFVGYEVGLDLSQSWFWHRFTWMAFWMNWNIILIFFIEFENILCKKEEIWCFRIKRSGRTVAKITSQDHYNLSFLLVTIPIDSIDKININFSHKLGELWADLIWRLNLVFRLYLLLQPGKGHEKAF